MKTKLSLIFIITAFSTLASAADVHCSISKIEFGRVTKTSKEVKIVPNNVRGTIEYKIQDFEADENVGGMVIGYRTDDLQVSLYSTQLDVGATTQNTIPVGVELEIMDRRYQLNCY